MSYLETRAGAKMGRQIFGDSGRTKTAITSITYWGRVTNICVSKLTIIGSDNGLSPGRRQAIVWTNDGRFLIGPLETNFSEILSEIHTFWFEKMHSKISSGNGGHLFLGLNVLKIKIFKKFKKFWLS